jgi:hypothetical protein
MTNYLGLDPDGRVIGYGPDPVFEHSHPAPEEFDPALHLGLAMIVDGELVLPGQVPKSVSMRQARLALLGAGLLGPIDQALAALPGAAGEAARIEWEYAATVDRDSPLISGLADALGLSAEQLDQLFIAAAGI